MKIFKKEKFSNYKIITIFGLKFKFSRRAKKTINDTLDSNEIYNLQNYDEEFYRGQALKSYQSATEILNLVKDIAPNIRSVVDVGCGVGTWLKAWLNINSNIEVKGFDCNKIDESFLYIPREKIEIVNLENLKFENINKKFDLCQSLECAEHLYEKDAYFHVELLTKLSDIVLFSAAAPKQTGTNHYNEREPKYWSDIFEKFGYLCYDPLRSKIWNDDKISWWYRQNIMIYINSNKIDDLTLNKSFLGSPVIPNMYYHPNLLSMYVK
ncbi:MAG: hypothetical protein ACO201_00380 [Rickettsiales bacterium]